MVVMATVSKPDVAAADEPAVVVGIRGRERSGRNRTPCFSRGDIEHARPLAFNRLDGCDAGVASTGVRMSRLYGSLEDEGAGCGSDAVMASPLNIRRIGNVPRHGDYPHKCPPNHGVSTREPDQSRSLYSSRALESGSPRRMSADGGVTLTPLRESQLVRDGFSCPPQNSRSVGSEALTCR
jgi:hypothetical protein